MPDGGDVAVGDDSTLVDDLIQPFNLQAGRAHGPALTGRLTRLGPLADDVLNRHDYPEPVALLVGQSLALGATLAGALKFNGVFTLQMQGDGPVSLVVVDITTADEGATYTLRSYAKFDAEKLEALESASARALLGKGYLALTVDQGDHTERYQGLVELVGDTLAEFAQHYFRQSQQMDAAVMVSAGREGDAGAWRAAGIMLQRVADQALELLPSDEGDDPWRRTMMLMATGTDAEMLDPELAPRRYLYRLFHEEGLRVTPPRPLTRGCRCSEARILNVLQQLPQEELLDLSIDGAIEVTCEFCNALYLFDPQTLEPR
ncbi:MAG: Hsp33 family molecular chaperone HslO [Alphaproteobacteria bacterium]|nr:Hsp33 family molecular chaperone HslO [Alphaproteobacteria bacterium]MCZ6510068.1 Hsp33 family molecular chaperone HslO [Alphaproteobacteria bacterium]MCZ6588646.1 Hsp33 family molecular chaperone HslO [Alphaproteobacteria bacterium]MCZ6590563.1 Hsp33 family molecular chaperone HslO [Alphaproteobacteria bacterium]MCZ6838170.1 Hsp33 family molecular chaperone HslO [Alphaproteobacteria bacterium]